jgi:hypothetical protein
VEQYRRLHPVLGPSDPGAGWGFFIVGQLFVISSCDGGWDHVSVSRQDRVPTWDEMCRIKDLFFDDEETVLQYHPPKSQYVNQCKYCLHLWRPHGVVIELPPQWMIG